MELTTFLVVIATFISWGLGAFIAKLAANKIGPRSVLFDTLGYTFVVIIYSLIFFKFKNLARANKLGIGLAILSGLVGSFGYIGFYLLMSRTEASRIAPLTALWPALTVVLAFVFLKESLDLEKVIGIIFSLVAIYFLAK